MIKLEHVTKTFEGFTALSDLSMTIPKGSVYGLVGPNGAGKSTVIRLITGVYRPDSGSITMDDVPVYENSQMKSRIAYIPDDIFYFPSASLDEMRKFYKGFYPQFDDALYERLFEMFQLPRKSQIRRFSKGMQKQAAFLLNISCRPDVLVLDEPVDGLDPVMRRQIMSIIMSDVAQRETTVLISSHNLRELEDICDYVGIMDKGHMLLERSLASIQGNTVKIQLAGAAPEGLDVIHSSSSGRLHTLVVRGTADEVKANVEKLNPVYYDVLPLSLEEIFIYELGGVNYEVKNILL